VDLETIARDRQPLFLRRITLILWDQPLSNAAMLALISCCCVAVIALV